MDIRNVPMWLVGALVLVGGVGFLTWHAYANDDDDEKWLDPGQPPAMVGLPVVPAHGAGAPMACGNGFRSRCYPDVMATLSATLAGEA